ncbi:MAG TPA: ATP-grasp domain-containing protein [Myxococcota bacterium]|nr:ATP-grasp domain-containing protein [Myxococcota bacterium]
MTAANASTQPEDARSTAHPAVVLTLSPTGLAVARSLAPRGVRVLGVDSHPREIGHYSRWISRDRRIAYLEPGPRLLDGLLAWGGEQAHPPVLFVAGDPYIDFVAEHHEALRRRFILPESMRPEVSSVFVNKRTFYERCLALGVAMPATFFPRDEGEAREAARRLRYPAIVKPSLGHLFRQRLGGEKLVQVHDERALLEWWQRFRAWGGDSVLQEVIVGPESNIFVAAVYTDAALAVRSLFTARKNRQYPPMFGSGSYMEASWSPEIAELSSDLVRKLGYRGVCGTEFKWEPRDRSWKLIEVNPRPTLWFSLTRAAGVDVIWDAYCDLTGQPNPVHVGRQDDAVRWQLLVRDLVSALHFLRRRELSPREFLRTVVDPRRKDEAMLSWRDPGTLVGLPMNTLWKYWANLRGGGRDAA